MIGFRHVINGLTRSRGVLSKIQPPMKTQIRHHDDHGPPAPFDNMPFRVTNRYIATVVFGLFFGLGLWAPYIIVWYSMAKRTL